MNSKKRQSGVVSQRQYSASDLDFLERIAQAEARESFWAFRQYMRPKMRIGWWQREIAGHLQTFYHRMTNGERPILLIQAPPQHGKSEQIVDFLAWLSGKNPDIKKIYASFSERLGVRANLAMQRMFDSPRYKSVFPDTKISERNSVSVSGQTLRNREIIEYVNRDGYFRNTTVRGSVTGEGLDLGVLDDPIKGREEANSPTIRDKTWDWLTDDFMSRFSDGAALLGIMTRWHVDDPFGRLIDNDPSVVVLRYPALAETDELHRKEGEPLFPEHKSLEFLNERKSIMHEYAWESLYQQNPYVVGGNLFHSEHWRFYEVPPTITHRVIYADTAQKTKEENDRSVFECWGKTDDGRAVMLDLIKGRWEAPELLSQARAFWNKHKVVTGKGRLRAMKIEDKVSGTGLIQTLKREGIPVKGIQRSIDKVTRALDVIPSIEAGLVFLPQDAAWLSEFLTETSQFPNGVHDDQVDPMMDAIDDLLLGTGRKGTAGVW